MERRHAVLRWIVALAIRRKRGERHGYRRHAIDPDRLPADWLTGAARTGELIAAHELLCLNRGAAGAQAYLRGGLAAWQRSRVAEYIEEHVAESVLLSRLAEVVQLSPFHFSRAFKQSFGVPPLRYLASRRIKRAKDLLAGDATVTQVGLAVGFAETSSFTTAFRKHVGMTPTAFRRGLE